MLMYKRRELRFLIGLGLSIVLIVILFIFIFTHHSSPQPSQRALASYSSDPTAQVALLIDGPVNAESEHNQVQIVISNSDATINVFSGYNDKVVNTKNYYLSEAGYNVFLRSLEYAGFMKGTNDPALANASGYCPTGDRYIFSFNDAGQQKWRYWQDSCGGDPHTFDGNFNLTMQLFEAEIPSYSDITGNLNI